MNVLRRDEYESTLTLRIIILHKSLASGIWDV